MRFRGPVQVGRALLVFESDHEISSVATRYGGKVERTNRRALSGFVLNATAEQARKATGLVNSEGSAG